MRRLRRAAEASAASRSSRAWRAVSRRSRFVGVLMGIIVAATSHGGPGAVPAVMESVWDFPRPPRVEPSARRARVELGGVVVADSGRALRVLETSHPPVLYLPPGRRPRRRPARGRGRTLLRVQGRRDALDVVAGGRTVPAGAWTYRDPAPGYEALRDHVAFYPGRMDACRLDDERVRAQAGDFYGGLGHGRPAGAVQGRPGDGGLVRRAA